MQKNKKVFLILMASLSTLSCMSSYAGKDSCPDDIVHCAYFSGLSDNLNDGRYIKLYNKHVGSITICFNGTSTIFMDEFGAEKYLGNNTDVYSICTDSGGNNCEQIGVDNFVVTKKHNDYSAKPKYFNIDVSALKNKYPACDELFSSHLNLYK